MSDTDLHVAYDDLLDGDDDSRLPGLIRDLEAVYPRVHPSSTLSHRLTAANVAPVGGSRRRLKMPRPRIRYALPALVAAAVVGALLLSSSMPGPGPSTVSARTLMKRMISASLPPPLHSTEYTYTIRLRCPRGTRCPTAIVRQWTANLRGAYDFDSRMMINTFPLLGLQLYRGELYGSLTSPEGRPYSEMPGSPVDVSPKEWQNLERRHPVVRLFGAFRQAWEGVEMLDGFIVHRYSPAIEDFLLSAMLAGPTGRATMRTASFIGQPAYLLKAGGLAGADTHLRMYLNPKSYEVLGIRASSCAIQRQGHGHSPPPCVRWVTTRLTLRSTHTVPICQAPRWSYSPYFKGMLVRANNLPIRHVHCPG